MIEDDAQPHISASHQSCTPPWSLPPHTSWQFPSPLDFPSHHLRIRPWSSQYSSAARPHPSFSPPSALSTHSDWVSPCTVYSISCRFPWTNITPGFIAHFVSQLDWLFTLYFTSHGRWEHQAVGSIPFRVLRDSISHTHHSYMPRCLRVEPLLSPVWYFMEWDLEFDYDSIMFWYRHFIIYCSIDGFLLFSTQHSQNVEFQCFIVFQNVWIDWCQLISSIGLLDWSQFTCLHNESWRLGCYPQWVNSESSSSCPGSAIYVLTRSQKVFSNALLLDPGSAVIVFAELVYSAFWVFGSENAYSLSLESWISQFSAYLGCNQKPPLWIYCAGWLREERPLAWKVPSLSVWIWIGVAAVAGCLFSSWSCSRYLTFA